ncbi:MAG: Rrf2 family transcriptional regulator [Clostridiales bacterium]|nr:Rrf2 family transcriptional regulator [Clostridiales bacterium]
MKLSTKGRYGIHAMYDLALSGNDAPQPISRIAERQNIPEAYLEQLFGTLRRSGLVASVRGAAGGYLLSRPPGEITVGEVLRALEGELAFVDCLLEDDACDRSHTCPTRLVLGKVYAGVNRIVDGITLQDMIDDYQKPSAKEGIV